MILERGNVQTGRVLSCILDIKEDFGEVSGGHEEQVIGNERKRCGPCYNVKKSLPEWSSIVSWKIMLVSDDTGI